jgi:hypothetical protein
LHLVIMSILSCHSERSEESRTATLFNNIRFCVDVSDTGLICL